jgi:hypothetical protein
VSYVTTTALCAIMAIGMFNSAWKKCCRRKGDEFTISKGSKKLSNERHEETGKNRKDV